MDELASPNALYLRMDHKESNKTLIVSHMDDRQCHQMNTMLQFVHMKCEIFLPRVEEGGIRGWCEVEHS